MSDRVTGLKAVVYQWVILPKPPIHQRWHA